jgi:hypothetical protein
MGTFGVIFIPSNETVADEYKFTSEYTINPKSWNSSQTKINIITGIRTLDWISNISQKCSVTVILNQSDNVQKIIIHEVWITIYGIYNETRDTYSGGQVAADIQTNDELYKEGDLKEYTFSFAIAGEHERFAIVGHVDLTMIDVDGQEDYTIIEPFVQDTAPPNSLKISVSELSEFFDFSTFLMYVAFGAILGVIVAVILFAIYVKKKETSHLPQAQSGQKVQPLDHQDYSCLTCGQSLTYVHAYSRWYCTHCEKYV